MHYMRYFAYGVPFGIPAGDQDADGTTGSADIAAIQQLIDTSSYSNVADLNADGSVNSSDIAIAESEFEGVTLGFKTLSGQNVNNALSYFGSLSMTATPSVISQRHRAFVVGLGRWCQRDPLQYSDSYNPYQLARSNPVTQIDPLGLLTLTPGSGSASPGGSMSGDGDRLVVGEGPPDGEAWCEAQCDIPGLLGVAGCVNGSAVICICHSNIDDALGGAPSSGAKLALTAAVTAHEQAHAAGLTCLFRGYGWSSCGHPCAYDAEVDMWDSLYTSGACDPACQGETHGQMCEACGNASPGKQAGAFCSGNCP